MDVTVIIRLLFLSLQYDSTNPLRVPFNGKHTPLTPCHRSNPSPWQCVVPPKSYPRGGDRCVGSQEVNSLHVNTVLPCCLLRKLSWKRSLRSNCNFIEEMTHAAATHQRLFYGVVIHSTLGPRPSHHTKEHLGQGASNWRYLGERGRDFRACFAGSDILSVAWVE